MMFKMDVSSSIRYIQHEHLQHTHVYYIYIYIDIYIYIYVCIKTILTVKKFYLSKKCISNSKVPAFLAVRFRYFTHVKSE